MPASHFFIRGVILGVAALLLVGCARSGDQVTPPRDLSYASPQTYPVGLAIAPLSPMVTGTVTGYDISPALPIGLAISADTGQITGTPTAATPATLYAVTARNAGGSATFKLSIAVATVTVTPAAVSRLVASGTSVGLQVLVTPVNFAASGTVYAKAEDPTLLFDPSVAVAARGSGYALTLTTSTTAAANHYTGQVTIHLCSDSACNVPLTVASVSLPYDVSVLAATTAWPGDNLIALSGWPGVPDWSMFQGNAAHTGFVPITLDPNKFTTRWQLAIPPLNAGNYPDLNSVMTSNGQLYYGGYDNMLYARKESDGSVAWQYDFSSLAFPSVNPPAVANGVVYVAAGQQSSTYLYALNATAGLLLFRSPMTSQWEHYLAPAIGPSGVYTNAGTNGGLYGFDLSGTPLFFAGLPQTSIWTPAVDATSVYAYTGDALRVLDPVTGTTTATITDPAFVNSTYEIDSAAMLGAPGNVFAVDRGRSLIDFNTTAGSIGWKIAGQYVWGPAYNAGVVYIGNYNPLRVEARSEADGSLLWAWQPPQPRDSYLTSEILLTNNLLFVCTDQSTYAVDTGTHELVWSYPRSGRLALSSNGVLYISGGLPYSNPSLLTAINVK